MIPQCGIVELPGQGADVPNYGLSGMDAHPDIQLHPLLPLQLGGEGIHRLKHLHTGG